MHRRLQLQTVPFVNRTLNYNGQQRGRRQNKYALRVQSTRDKYTDNTVR